MILGNFVYYQFIVDTAKWRFESSCSSISVFFILLCKMSAESLFGFFMTVDCPYSLYIVDG